MARSPPPSKRPYDSLLDDQAVGLERGREPKGVLRRAYSAPSSAAALEQKNADELAYWCARQDLANTGGDGCFNCDFKPRSASPRRSAPSTSTSPIPCPVSAADRATVVDWLAELRHSFKLHPESLFLSVNYFDRCLTSPDLDLSRPRLQLLGMACLWLASKFNEVHPPGCRALTDMAQGAYSSEELVEMERAVLKVLSFSLTVPTPFRFAHYLMELAPLPPHPDMAAAVRQLAEALAELSLLDTDLATAQPSAAAAAAVYLAACLLAARPAQEWLARHCVVDPASLVALVTKLMSLLQQQLAKYEAETAALAPPQRLAALRACDVPCALLIRYLAWAAVHRCMGSGMGMAAQLHPVDVEPLERAAAASVASAASIASASAISAATAAPTGIVNVDMTAQGAEPSSARGVAVTDPAVARPSAQPPSKRKLPSASSQQQQQPPAALSLGGKRPLTAHTGAAANRREMPDLMGGTGSAGPSGCRAKATGGL
ncbi:CYCAB3 protein [Gonium pectorale]|uniref:CYCAB3 protein n=1 Tax=Gonium pectorale TaxID=33097 RepID=A0A150G8D8_GONPE|nr:CYCAB3 protein [Gonium pectorale]|eukprot:KXZ46112.1 CYCAB3 protein [Gonium pectorale]